MKQHRANGKHGTAKNHHDYGVDYEDEEDYRDFRKKKVDLSRRQSRRDKYRDQA
ncbi:hypothetical protein [Emcibacter nanhaiensis]|uniref:hypothetical protein n=1 Tax=Emcibacter nanhaiensis TaxID=1505037 RepID=UPI0015E48309|nr:hypothetical protein [Emcibacter nanhaiensis]